MRLPDLQYGWRKYKRDTLAIHGINYSDATMDGDLADCAGLSTRRYPYFTTRHGRPAVDGYDGVTAVYRYKDSIFTVAEEKLFWIDLNSTDEAQYLHTVMPGAKQFVTINTKVVVWPDKLMIDMTSNPPTVRDMGASFETVGVDTIMTSNTLTIPNVPRTDKQAITSGFRQGTTQSLQAGFWFKTYKGLKWTNDEYDLSEATVYWKEVGGAGTQGGTYQIVPGDILIPVAVGDDAMRAQVYTTTYGYTPGYCPTNQQDDLSSGGGYYLQVKEVIGDIVTASNGRIVENRKITYNVFKFGAENPALRSIFRAGDALSITGHPLPINNKEIVVTTGVTDETLTFDNNTFTPADYTGTITQDTMDALSLLQGDVTDIKFGSICMFHVKKQDGHWCFTDSASGEINYKRIKAGQILFTKDTFGYVLDIDETVFQCYKVSVQSGDYPTVTAKSVAPLHLTITRAMPQIDYICEKDNRLWGVVNHQNNRVWDADTETWKTFESRLIVASSLGMPDDFYDYNGAYSAAYAVAVASEGDFTGICPYGDSVLAWKEKRLCKVMGDAPATYSLNEYVVDGVQSGAHGTQVNISETLIYKGVNGIYAYAGGTPRLISSPFGERRYTAEAAGTDGERYFITLTDAAGNTHLHSYDVQRGLWLRESGDNAIGYADLPVGFCALLSDGMLRLMDSGADDPTLEWYAQFTPFYETLDGKKRYAKLLLRLELGAGAHVRVLERVDGGLWKQIGMIAVAAKNPVTVPVNIARGDKMEFRLEGNGACTILGIQRQFFMHSEV